MKWIAKLLAVVVLFSSSTGCGGKLDESKIETAADILPSEKVEKTVNVARSEMTFQIRNPRSRDAVLVRLKIDRLREYDLSKEDVMNAVKPAGVVDREEALPPPGVVFNAVLRPAQYENIILKANAEGEIVRLKDVAELETLAGRDAEDAEPNAGADGRGE